MITEINMNAEVSVTLTEKGREIAADNDYAHVSITKGVFKSELWHLMQLFGTHVFNGCTIPFEKNTITLVDNRMSKPELDEYMDDQLGEILGALSDGMSVTPDPFGKDSIEQVRSLLMDIYKTGSLGKS